MIKVTIKQKEQGYSFDNKMQGEFESLEQAKNFIQTFFRHFPDASADVYGIEYGRRVTISYDSDLDNAKIEED